MKKRSTLALAGPFMAALVAPFAGCSADAATPGSGGGGDEASGARSTDEAGGARTSDDADAGAASDAPLAHDASASDAGPCLAQTPSVPAVKIVDVTTGTFSGAVYAIQAPGSDDWYVVEQGGVVRLARAGTVLSTPFLDLRAAIGTQLGERGLLSIAFHPAYAQNGRLFVMGTPGEGADGTFSATSSDAVVEFARDPANHDVAVPTKVRDIVVLPVSAANHNGGTVAFGPDNYLYVGTGDGGGGCESSQPGAAQDTNKLFGKILRLDVDGSTPFAAPGNPFASDPRVYHYGLRNPFRWGFDPVTFDLFIGDVGQSASEEISVAAGNAPGKNFGWPAYEGAEQGTCGSRPLGGPSPATPPIVSIDRRPGSSSPFADYRSIIGGRVYRGAAMAALSGVYFFADFGGQAVGALRYCNGQVYGPVAVATSAIPTSSGGTLATVSSIVDGHDGELYVTYGFAPSRLGKLAPR